MRRRPSLRRSIPVLVLAFVAIAVVVAFAVTRVPKPAPAPSAVPALATAEPAAPATAPAAPAAPSRTAAPRAAAPPHAAAAPAAAAAVPPHAAGMLVGIDPETGRLGRPSQAFRERVASENAQALDRSMEGLTVVTRPDGSKAIDLKGRFQEYMVVRIAPNGRKKETCVPGDQVDAALHAPAGADSAAAPALEVR